MKEEVDCEKEEKEMETWKRWKNGGRGGEDVVEWVEKGCGKGWEGRIWWNTLKRKSEGTEEEVEKWMEKWGKR